MSTHLVLAPAAYVRGPKGSADPLAAAGRAFQSAHMALNHSWLYHSHGKGMWLVLAAVIFAVIMLHIGYRRRSA